MKNIKLFYTLDGVGRIFLLIIPYFIIVGFIQVITFLLLGYDLENFTEEQTSIQKLISLFSSFIGTFLLLWLFMRFVDKEKFINLGFHLKNRLKEINLGIGLGAVIMFLGFVILLTFNEIIYKKISFDFVEFVISIGIFLLVAIVEETLFRGYILKNLMLSFNKYLALVISSILFSLMHAANPSFDLVAFFDLFLAGILLGLSYIFTKNLWFPIALHFSWNFFQTHVGFNVSGQDLYSIIEIDILENNLLNGGGFGFEGSILSLIFQVISIILIYKYFKTKKAFE